MKGDVAIIYLLVPKVLLLMRQRQNAQKLSWDCRTNIFTCSKGLAAYAAKTECTKITLGS